jgi:hypothetical protein
MEQFQNIIDVIEHSGGSIGNDPGILQALVDERNETLADMTVGAVRNLKKEVQEQYLKGFSYTRLRPWKIREAN